ncbi:helix-turn-helix domain-containing protein [Pedobacter sp. ASV12]|uniref:helix-turn-helix domain-containing protein n=1 Tax=Pedobacter sp. ASV12 TaxID=2795120 RepID=UPI0018EAEA30|nr:helix-turn-helix domain-containing protein [Pedobacter sp. ASV12]
MDYQTFEVSPEINAFVKCAWTLESPALATEQRQTIVPDGCMEMIFHYGDLYRQYRNEEEFIVQPRCFVFGQLTSTLSIAPTGSIGIFALRFNPEGFLPFTTWSVQQLANKAVPLAELFGEAGLQLEKEVLAATSTAERIKLAESFLLLKLQETETANSLVKSCINAMLALNGQLSVGRLSEQLHINRRQLERKFATTVGLSPKQLNKIIRLQTALKMLAEKRFDNLTALAYEASYYDQAHFIKDFKEFTGLSPKKFYAANLQLSKLFVSTA